MYAIVKCGGKQYKVEEEMLFKVEKLNAEIGESVQLEVLMFADDNGNVKVGADAAKTTVEAVVNSQDKFPKILVLHYKAKKQIRKRQGHRQPYTELKITSIKG